MVVEVEVKQSTQPCDGMGAMLLVVEVKVLPLAVAASS